jgi:Ca2+-binding EF-hand superfamily protein
MTENFYSVLGVIFQFFDRDGDGGLNRSELNNFWQTVNGEPIDKQSLQFLQRHFEHDRRGRLTHTGLLQLFLSQTAGNPQETWKDLLKLGWDNHLEPIDDRYATFINNNLLKNKTTKLSSTK